MLPLRIPNMGVTNSALVAVVNLLSSNEIIYNFIISMGLKPHLTSPIQKEVIRLFFSLSQYVTELQELTYPLHEFKKHLDVSHVLAKIISNMDVDTRNLFKLRYSEQNMCGCLTASKTVDDFKLVLSAYELFENNTAINANEMLSDWAAYEKGICDKCEKVLFIRRSLIAASDFIIIQQPSNMHKYEYVVTIDKERSEVLRVGETEYHLVGGITWEWPDMYVTWHRQEGDNWLVIDGPNSFESKLPNEIDHFRILLYQIDLDQI